MPKLNLTERVLPKMTQQRKSAANERCRAEMLRWPSKEKSATKDCYSGTWI